MLFVSDLVEIHVSFLLFSESVSLYQCRHSITSCYLPCVSPSRRLFRSIAVVYHCTYRYLEHQVNRFVFV